MATTPYKGKPKLSGDALLLLKTLVDDYIAGKDAVRSMKTDLAGMRPVDRLNSVVSLMKFVYPTQGSLAVKPGEGQDIEIKVSYKTPAPKAELDEDESANDMDYSERD